MIVHAAGKPLGSPVIEPGLPVYDSLALQITVHRGLGYKFKHETAPIITPLHWPVAGVAPAASELKLKPRTPGQPPRPMTGEPQKHTACEHLAYVAQA